MIIGDFGRIYLVKFIHLRHFYMIFEDVHGWKDRQMLPMDNSRCVDIPLHHNRHHKQLYNAPIYVNNCSINKTRYLHTSCLKQSVETCCNYLY